MTEPQHLVSIYDVEQRELVTAIEILSPTNKSGRGFRVYLRRREHYLMSAVHLLEIDLLRQGKHVPMRQTLPDSSYFVFLSRNERRPISEVWPLSLRAPLPSVPVPLLAGDNDILLDLQDSLSRAYDDGGYDTFDYNRPPEVPLPPEDAVWAEERIRAWQRGQPT